VSKGECVRIFTGSSIPAGTDSVVMIENTSEVDSGYISVNKGISVGENIFQAGENAKKGEVLLNSGTYIGPGQIAVLASVGQVRISMYKKPIVGVLCTGRELRDINETVKDFQIRNSNGPMLAACLRKSGLATVIELKAARDEYNVISRSLKKALETCSVIITSGGISVGKYDLVPRVLEDLGFSYVFKTVSIKPGKPTLLAKSESGKIVFGLPGNPLSTLNAFYEFVVPGLAKMAGSAEKPLNFPKFSLAESFKNKGGRIRFVPVKLVFSSNGGGLQLSPVRTMSSSDLVAAGKCDGVMVLDPLVGEYRMGDMVEFHSWKGHF
jgi:molybdopterin molybdotransferase